MTRIQDSTPLPEALSRLIRQIAAHRTSHAIAAAVELGLPEELGDEPKTAGEIAAATGTKTDLMLRLLAHLAHAGLIALGSDGRFAAMPAMALLRRDNPCGVANWLRFEFAAPVTQAWIGLPSQIKTDVVAFERINGAPLFNWMERDRDTQTRFDRAMSSSATMMSAAAVSAIRPLAGSVVIDVGGGDGTVLASVLDANPTVSGVLYELDRPERRFSSGLTALIRSGRARVEHGSFLDHVPDGGDIYLLGRVLHDFNDDDAARILTRLRLAAGIGARLCIIEMLLDPAKPTPMASGQDLLMMVLLGGRERSLADFGNLARLTGWDIDAVTETDTPLSLLTWRPSSNP